MEQRWIPVSERLPEAETEVFITAKRKYRDGTYGEIVTVTTAMYEDGTVLENDSCWNWAEINGEWDEENDCYIVPEGWWEDRHYNPDDVYNNAVDDEVIAWMPLPEPYRGELPKQTNADRIRGMTHEELATFCCKVKADYQWADHEYPDEDACEDWEEWLRAESEG